MIVNTREQAPTMHFTNLMGKDFWIELMQRDVRKPPTVNLSQLERQLYSSKPKISSNILRG